MRFETGNILTLKKDRAVGRREKAAQQVEARRFPCPIGANQADNFPFRNGHIQVADRRQTPKVLT
jgi:hypothetical protein